MKIVVTEPRNLTDGVRATLSCLGSVVYGPFDDERLLQELADCDALMIRLGRYIDDALLSQAARLRFILTATTGLDHIDVEAAHAAGVRIVSLRDCPNAIQDVSATAEHCFGLILALARRIPAASRHVVEGGWDRDQFWGMQLRGKQLGIIGHGRIGRMVARYADAFGMSVAAFDMSPVKITTPAMPLAFDEVLRTSDVVTVHVMAGPANHNLINATAVAHMKHGAILVNTSRGSVVNENAVADALASQHLAGAAFDVLSGEESGGCQASPLLACARAGYNVLVTPHIGGATHESIALTEAAIVERFTQLLDTEV